MHSKELKDKKYGAWRDKASSKYKKAYKGELDSSYLKKKKLKKKYKKKKHKYA